MKRFIPEICLLFVLLSCSKKESDFAWERSLGRGEAFSITASADSGFSVCGQINGTPYFVRFNKKRNKVIDINENVSGLFNSSWYDNSGYLIAGTTSGKIYIARYSSSGNKLWEKSVTCNFKVDYTNLINKGAGNFLAVGTVAPDSLQNGYPGFYVVNFDTTGFVFNQKEITESGFISSNRVITDDVGNIYIATTRKTTGSKTKACVAKYNQDMQKLWETELYTNPEFGSASIDICRDNSGMIFVCGKTELEGDNKKINNSFIVSLNSSGTIMWKKYMEVANCGVAAKINNSGNLVILNRNCFVVDIRNTADGSDGGVFHVLSGCDPEKTDAFASDMIVDYSNDLIVTGSRGENFYVAFMSVL
jgi:hypothetical protein